MEEFPRVTLYTDGACPYSGSRAKCGGWANILIFGGQEIIRVGREYPSTSNRMELIALIDGLQALTVPCEVTFYSDSKILVRGTNEWLDLWVKRHWKAHQDNPVANQDLWQKVIASKHIHSVRGIWIRGHTGPYYSGRTVHHEYNERCDLMAVAQSVRMSEEKRRET